MSDTTTEVIRPTGESGMLFTVSTKNAQGVSKHSIFIRQPDPGLNAMAYVNWLADLLGAKLLAAGIAWDEVVAFTPEAVPQIFQLSANQLTPNTTAAVPMPA